LLQVVYAGGQIMENWKPMKRVLNQPHPMQNN